MLLYEFSDLVEFLGTKPACLLQGDRIQPELRYLVLTLYMDMGWFAIVHRYEEKAVRTYVLDCRHSAVYSIICLYHPPSR